MISVGVEHPLNFLGVVGLGQREHHEDARLLGIERVGNDIVHFVVLRLAVASDNAIPDTA